jgi:hypothetical protein
MRLLKILALLAAFCVLCTALLIAVGAGTVGPRVARYAVPRMVGAEVGRAIFLFGVSAAFAGVGFVLNRKKPTVRYPGLTIGIIVAIALTTMVWAGSQAMRQVHFLDRQAHQPLNAV